MVAMGLMNTLEPIPLATGLASFVPGLIPLVKRAFPSGKETISARYCYAVWMRHLVMARKNGYSGPIDTVAELGPGVSLGVGLAALLSGAQRYYALDVMRYASSKSNLKVFDELVGMFEARENIPDVTEFPRMRPSLPSYEFPKDIITDRILERTMARDQIGSLLQELEDGNTGERVRYFVPWHDPGVIMAGSVDMIISQAVMMQVKDLPSTYRAISQWTRPGGITSHSIDFSSLGTARQWNGHWAYGDLTWKLIEGKRHYLINREPHSKHLQLLQESGFDIICDVTTEDRSGIGEGDLAPGFRGMQDEDLYTRGAFIQAVKGG